MVNREASYIGQSAVPTTSPRLPYSYNFFIQSSKRLGVVAMKTLLPDSADVTVTARSAHMTSSAPSWLRAVIPSLSRPFSSNSAGQAISRKDDREQEKQAKLKEIVTQSHEILMTASSVFPVSLFPDTITLDRTKVTITRRDFFWSSDTMSIRIEDVLNVQITLGPLFGSLTIASRVMSTVDHFQVKHLWTSDAIRMKRIIQGYVIAQHNKIDTSHLKIGDLKETLYELGHDQN